MIKEAFVDTLLISAEKRAISKYNFEFETKPKYILEEQGSNFESYLGAL